VTASCELQACSKWNVQYTPVVGFVQLLPGDFRSNDVSSGWLSVTWGHVTSFTVTLLPPPVSYSLVSSEMYSTCEFLTFYSHFQATFGQMTSLPGNFQSLEVMWRHILSRDGFFLRATALYEVKCTVYASFLPSIATSMWLPVKLRHFQVTSDHLSSHDVIFCHVTASLCELQPCRKWSVQYMGVFGLLHPLPGHFRSNDISFVSLQVTWGHVTSLPVTWLPPPASYSFVGSEVHSIREFLAYSHFQVLPIKWRYFRFLAVSWGHVTSFPVMWLPPPLSYSFVGSEMHSIREFLAFHSHFLVNSGQMTTLQGHF